MPTSAPRCLGSAAQLFDRLRRGTHEDAVDHAFVLQGNRADVVRQRNNHVKVRNGQQLRRACRHPLGPFHRLALGTVAIATRVAKDQLVGAVVALIQVTTQGRRPASQNGIEDALLVNAERAAIPIQELRSVLSKTSATSSRCPFMIAFYLQPTNQCLTGPTDSSWIPMPCATRGYRRRWCEDCDGRATPG